MEVKDLFFGCLGNGVSVSNRKVEEHGDYKKVAHIATDGQITWYMKRIPVDCKAKILAEAEDVIRKNLARKAAEATGEKT